MARIRSVKPELRRSRTVANWPREVRYAWVLLWGYLDDYGRGEDELELLKADLFPRDRDVTERKLDGWLWMMAHAEPDDPDDSPPLCRYTVKDRRYLHAPKWNEHQRVNRPTRSRIPLCPIHEQTGSPHDGLTEPAVSPHGARMEGSRASRAPAEQGNKGTGSKGARDARDGVRSTTDERVAQALAVGREVQAMVDAGSIPPSPPLRALPGGAA